MKIERVDIYPVEYPTVGFFKFFTTPLGASGRPAVVIRIGADDGAVGWGQAVPRVGVSPEVDRAVFAAAADAVDQVGDETGGAGPRLSGGLVDRHHDRARGGGAVHRRRRSSPGDWWSPSAGPAAASARS